MRLLFTKGSVVFGGVCHLIFFFQNSVKYISCFNIIWEIPAWLKKMDNIFIFFMIETVHSKMGYALLKLLVQNLFLLHIPYREITYIYIWHLERTRDENTNFWKDFRWVLVQRDLQIGTPYQMCSWQSTMYKKVYWDMPPGYKSEVTEAEWETRIWNNQFVIKHALLITGRGAVAMRQNPHGLNEAGWFICLHWAGLYWFQVTWLAGFRSCSGDF